MRGRLISPPDRLVRDQGSAPIAITAPRSVPMYIRSSTTAIAPGWPVTSCRQSWAPVDPFSTDRDGSTLALEADHRCHASIENAIRDLKYGVGLNHLPSGRFGANAAWLAFQIMAHNLGRWIGQLGLDLVASTKTLRRRLFATLAASRAAHDA